MKQNNRESIGQTDEIRFFLYVYIRKLLLFRWEKQVNTLKWIGPQGYLLLSYLFLLNTCFWRFTSSSVSEMIFLVFPLTYTVGILLIKLCFFFIP